jgi:hypothetical protein
MNNEKDVGKDKPCKGRDSHGNPVASYRELELRKSPLGRGFRGG